MRMYVLRKPHFRLYRLIKISTRIFEKELYVMKALSGRFLAHIVVDEAIHD